MELEEARSTLQYYEPTDEYDGCYNRLKEEVREAVEDVKIAKQKVREQRYRLQNAQSYFANIQDVIERIKSVMQSNSPDTQLSDCIHFIRRYAAYLCNLPNI